jgi:hypothetical protein
METAHDVNELCGLLSALPLQQLYRMITLPPPFGDDARDHASTCRSCKIRIAEAHRQYMDSLSKEERQEIERLRDRLLVALCANSTKRTKGF